MTKKKSHILRNVLIVILIAAVAALAGFIYIYSQTTKAADSSNTTQTNVVIPDGSSTTAIAGILKDDGIINNELACRMRAKMDCAEYKAGTYSLSPSMTMTEISEILIKGRDNANTVNVTIPEGYTVKQIAEKMEKSGVCSADDFIAESENGQFDYEFLSGAVTGEHRLEGYLFPDTYELYKDSDPHAAIDKMLSHFNDVYNGLITSADSAVTSKYNENQIVTVASLIEREAKLDSERADVASVVYNRLDKGMKLQFCSTVQFALGKVKSRLYNSDLKIDSPYNTYLYDGLPPGPIAVPGKKSLEAAMNPASTDYLYFVVSSKGDGSHNFAATGDDFAAYRDDYLSSLTD